MELLESKTEKVVTHAISCVFLAVILCATWVTCVQIHDDTEFYKGYYQVEITSVKAANIFPSAQPEAPPRFNITARVVNHHSNARLSLQLWEADVSYAGVPLGAASFPETCLEEMTQKEVTVTTSTELVGLDAEVRRRRAELESSSQGGFPLQIDMTLRHVVRRASGRRTHSMQWLWCNATLDGHNGPSRCHIYKYTEPSSLVAP